MKAKKGDYVVLLSSCNGENAWPGSMPENYVYKLSGDCDSHHFYICKDLRGDTENGWDARPSYDSKLKVRLANSLEIQEYEKNEGPCQAIEINETYHIY